MQPTGNDFLLPKKNASAALEAKSPYLFKNSLFLLSKVGSNCCCWVLRFEYSILQKEAAAMGRSVPEGSVIFFFFKLYVVYIPSIVCVM